MKFLTIVSCLFFPLALGAQSVLSTGQWFKFSVEIEGVYKISAVQLQRAGLDIRKVNPKNIKLYGGCFGMLPQSNSADRINALQEIAITVAGEEDGAFNDSDYILFYGQNPDRFQFNAAKNIYSYENNYFTDLNFYFVTVSADVGKRIPTPPPVEGTFPIVSRFNDFAYYEVDKNNILNSGRQWFGAEFFGSANTLPVTYEIAGIVPNTELKWVSRIAVKYPMGDCSFDISVNDQYTATQTVNKVSGVDYEPVANIRIDTLTLNSSTLKADQGRQDIKYLFKPSGGGSPSGYVDFFTFTFLRALAQYESKQGTFFTSAESLRQAVSTFTITNVSGQSVVWDVTDPFHAKKQTLSLNGAQGSFNASTDALKRFGVFASNQVEEAKFVKAVPNQDLSSLSGIHYLVITHDNFLNQATRLANHRASFNHWKTAVVTVEQIYNEFSGGKQDITALRDFIRALYNKPKGVLKNVVLFGRGTYDYKDIGKAKNNFVPIYESRESVAPQSSYASDDYLGMLAPEQGEWAEIASVHDTLAIGLGRLPVGKAAEAEVIVNKLIEYDTGDQRFGEWRSSLLFVADDEDDIAQYEDHGVTKTTSIHILQANQLAEKIELPNKEFIVSRLFLDDFPQLHSPGSQSSPECYNAFAQAVDKGYAIVNYTGHGSTSQLASENILNREWVEKRENGPRYPLFITATCEFGRNDNPTNISVGEQLVLQKGGGAIGLISSVRPVLASSNFLLNTAFYNALVKLSGGKYRPLGTLFKEAKNNGPGDMSGRNYIYLGDPGVTLPFPNRKMTISNLATSTHSKDIQALAPIAVSGEVTDKGMPLPNYTGDLKYIVFDCPISHTTKGDGNTPFTYKGWSNQLARGKAKVTNGKFEFNMMLSKNYSAAVAASGATSYPDSLRLYLYSNDELIDYSGFNFQPSVKGINPQAPSDKTPPTINLYINDLTFVNGGTVGTTAKLIAFLKDEHGINVSSLDPDTALRMMLDGMPYDLFGHYTTSDNDYTQGRIDYLLTNLKTGKHVITLYAADTYGNKASASITFYVSSRLAADEFAVFPNPATEKAHFTFTRSQLDEELDGFIEIFSTLGSRVATLPIKVTSHEYRVILTEWDFMVNERKIASGLYLARLTLRSIISSETSQQSTRLVVHY